MSAAREGQSLTPLTKANLARAIWDKTRCYSPSDPAPAAWVADTILRHDLTRVIAGKHMGKTITIGALFESLYGERLSLKR